jgi:hypothetical protein
MFVQIVVELLLSGLIHLLEVVVHQIFLRAADQLSEKIEIPCPHDQQYFGPVVGLVLGHVEVHGISDQ